MDEKTSDPAPATAPPSRGLRRRLRIYLALAVALLAWAFLWQPGSSAPLPPSSHHGVWLTHAWWGDDAWFAGSSRKKEDYRGDAPVTRLAQRMRALGLAEWYVHACPAQRDGSLPAIDIDQARRLVAANPDGAVLAWVGGVLHASCEPADPRWRAAFAGSCAALVRDTGIAGIQLNLEPCPSFEPGYLELLDELRAALPAGARLSIAAYPPPVWLHPHPDVHWTRPFYAEVSRRADDLAVMAYDTAQTWRKTYTWIVAGWTREALAWSSAPVRIGIPAYDDAGVGYHDPRVENAWTALAGVAAGLGPDPGEHWAGIAVYADWTLHGSDERALRDYGVAQPP